MADYGEANCGKDTESGDKSKSHSPEINATPTFGYEDWFRDVVGLPNWIFDPLKDINHMRNDKYSATRWLRKGTPI